MEAGELLALPNLEEVCMRVVRSNAHLGQRDGVTSRVPTDVIYPLSCQSNTKTTGASRLQACKTNELPLRQRDLFQKLSSEELRTVLSKCVERRFKAGSLLYSQGTRHIDTFIIKKGVIRTYYSSPLGREIALAYWSIGDLVGGPNFFDEEEAHLWSAQVVEDCSVLAIKGHDFRSVAASIPALAEQVFDAMCFKMRWFSLLVQTLGTESVYSRLANLLAILSDLYGVVGHDGIEIKSFSQEDLAHMIGATRQAVSVALGHLQRAGSVRIRRRRLMVLNVELLRNLNK